MDNRRVGATIFLFSFIFLAFLVYVNSALGDSFIANGCSMTEDCMNIDGNLTLVHFGFGFFGFMLGLGFYFFFFAKSELQVLQELEKESKKRLADSQFDIVLKFLNASESKVLKKIREEEGITQSTLKYRLDMSKARLSYILQDFEKRGIIKRVKKGKSQEIYLKF